MADDWWDDVYDPDAPDTASSSPAPKAGTIRRAAGGGRLPAPGQLVDLDAAEQQPDTDPDTADTGPDDADEVPDSPDTERAAHRWDPTRVADRLVDAHRTRPIQQRAADQARAAMSAVTQPRPRLGQLAYGISTIAVPWWIGVTPWLTGAISGAPTGISVALILAGWAVGHRTARAVTAVAWVGRCTYTACVIAAFLHP
ncbi:hypothetical protein LHJ74_14620 [Streptomyces sp. N2-109]|uniref:Uncharacterized protein n=1 Tax=Streptomyces gossypii TaxID=2883101 RepID=A0ABT2JTD0_9ACTN|nr:hypothetical protein [Streptomyces gossypii]MCT2591127.1 hypothetical protein [Streptomyces gossypii]